jgi:hypothetical protein
MIRHRRHHASLFVGLVLVGFLAGCGTAKPPPPWQAKTLSASDAAVSAYLQGQVKIAAIQMKQAQFSASSTGRPEAVYKLNLLQCALDVSSLGATPCPRPEDVGIRSDSSTRSRKRAFLRRSALRLRWPLQPMRLRR